MPRLSINAYAKHRGVHLKTVQQAIAEGRIEKDANGKIDQEKADYDWEMNTDPAKQNNVKNKKNAEFSGEIKGPSYQQSRAVREAYQAKLAKLEYEEKAEKLVDAEQVKREAFEEGRRIRDALLSIPARISSQLLTAKSAFDVEQILTEELTLALKNLSDES